MYVVALRGFSLGNPAFPRGCEQGHLYKPATRPARRIGQGKTFPRPIFSRASSARANSPNWACKQVCASRASRCFVGKKSPLHLLEITIFYRFDSWRRWMNRKWHWSSRLCILKNRWKKARQSKPSWSNCRMLWKSMRKARNIKFINVSVNGKDIPVCSNIIREKR